MKFQAANLPVDIRSWNVAFCGQRAVLFSEILTFEIWEDDRLGGTEILSEVDASTLREALSPVDE